MNNMITSAIRSLSPDGQFLLTNEDLNQLEWMDNSIPRPSDEAIYAEAARLQSEFDASEYQRLRRIEYNKLNQYEMQFDDAVNGTSTWIDAIKAIKAKYPKG